MNQKKDFSQYEDMLDLNRPISRTHPPMDIMDRAAQFSPFAALTGYGDAVKETARQTERRQELDEYEKAALDEQLHELEAQMRSGKLSGMQSAGAGMQSAGASVQAACVQPAGESLAEPQPQVTITYFVPDEHKEGGAYRTITGNVKKIDYYGRRIILENGTQDGEVVPVDDIFKLDIHVDFDSRI